MWLNKCYYRGKQQKRSWILGHEFSGILNYLLQPCEKKSQLKFVHLVCSLGFLATKGRVQGFLSLPYN